jgi:hypothetical protein
MDIVLALALTLAAADPALAGAPSAAPAPPPGTVVMQGYDSSAATHTLSTSREYSQHVSVHPFPPPPTIIQGRAATASYEVRHEASAPRAERPIGAYATGRGTGRTVTLEPGFFAGGLTGGVEAPVHSYRVYGRGVVIVRGPHAPRSAGQAAAALSLPRG